MNHVAPNLEYLMSLTKVEGPDGDPWLRIEEVEFAEQMYADYRDFCTRKHGGMPASIQLYKAGRSAIARELGMLPADMAAVIFAIVCRNYTPKFTFEEWGWPLEAMPLITKMALEEMNEAVNG